MNRVTYNIFVRAVDEMTGTTIKINSWKRVASWAFVIVIAPNIKQVRTRIFVTKHEMVERIYIYR